MWQRFTERLRQVVFLAQNIAEAAGEKYVSPEHLLLGLIEQSNTIAVVILLRLGVSISGLREEIRQRLEPAGPMQPKDMQLHPRSKRVIDLAYDSAKELKNDYIGTEHLLLALLAEGGLAADTLNQHNVDIERARREAIQMQADSAKNSAVSLPSNPPASDAPSIAASSRDEPSNNNSTPDSDKSKMSRGWNRFTEKARRTIFIAQEAADRLGENEVSAEHLLLGLVQEDDSLAARILSDLGVSLAQIRTETRQAVTRGPGRLRQEMRLSASAMRVIDAVYAEARLLNNNYVGTEHLLLALIREQDGPTGRVLQKVGLDLERTREKVRRIQSQSQGA